MESLALVASIVGLLLSVVGAIWFLIVAFRASVLWGLGCLLLPIVSLVFLVLNFGETWKPALLSFVGTVIVLGAAFGLAAP